MLSFCFVLQKKSTVTWTIMKIFLIFLTTDDPQLKVLQWCENNVHSEKPARLSYDVQKFMCLRCTFIHSIFNIWGVYWNVTPLLSQETSVQYLDETIYLESSTTIPMQRIECRSSMQIQLSFIKEDTRDLQTM